VVRGRSAVATFYVAAPLTHDSRVMLDAAAAHHARVRRLGEGEAVCLTDGKGSRARAVLAGLARSALEIHVQEVEHVAPPPVLHLLVPIGDRDRMLWLAEKASELGVTSWQSVRFERSKSVTPRGEGTAFLDKVHARMVAALEQSSGAWIPEVLPEIDAAAAVASNASATRLMLDVDGPPVLGRQFDAPVAIALGPEGGVTPGEREGFVASGWLPTSLGATTLRFETAAIAAAAVVRAALQATKED
jgi:16S rRNA (uracil1498-N3)-methyltransferase